jgi:hypothetical protein
MRVIIFILGLLIVGCSGGNQATETGGFSQSVKHPYSPPVQDIRNEQLASTNITATTQNDRVPKRKEERSKRYLPPYPVLY